ncbi:unnamed protein product [Trichogramma brassicae]|uniref:Uncharacterized protein n=1 Tax=Trichogramma brassicae TaxID=86971 RepID=A0A6H5I7U6_9HYME|nr:unnamed protein product [Trichogramma brassicae]
MQKINVIPHSQVVLIFSTSGCNQCDEENLGSESRPVSGRGTGERFSVAQRRSHSDFSRERKWLRRNVRGLGEVARRENDAGRELINLVVV